MTAKLEKIENSEAYIEIEVSAEQVEEGLQYAYRKVIKQVAIPGFRKGKAPRELLELQFGKEVLFQDALEYIVPEAYDKALEELNIKPIAQPEFDINDPESGQPFKFNARVPVKPEVKLGEIEGIEVEIPDFQVKEEDVIQKFEDMRQQYAQVVEKIEEPAAMGDKLNIDFEGFIDGEAFAGGKGEDYSLELGSNTFIPGFEEQLVGLKAGESKDVLVTFPESYHAEDLAGKDAVFQVSVKRIETTEARELNDEFAQEVSQFNTIDELRQDIRKNLEEMAESRRKESIKTELMEKALEKCDIPVPDAVINMQVERMLQDFEQRMAYQGLTLEQYFQFTNSNREDFSQKIWPEAEKSVKGDFMLEKLAEEKGMEVSEEELNEHIMKLANNFGMEVDKIKEELGDAIENIRTGLKIDKAIDFLIDKAVVKEVAEITAAAAE
ncbi:trigger factor [Syntrophomonas wolfei]|uniref:Trigger factor n=1 Tax=Syntrophomonas wolfei subsp. wolfei (strain DSM 2245B / Goettingen) TaxID=335541 RepID=TIG_SYNWW|nr:trigger factor [Syntrophomonas wolfei]Q0AWE9.1 RecName: Full=Trigger factor; Short=TF; AltName: Full=PPIase [Syntrophomonas wolfei subsp. wolfei str. Goettingen G311]ABI68955.1 trigger factor [Syntrophomonas wolfei subsp. wolfei str. Goettingen G311]